MFTQDRLFRLAVRLACALIALGAIVSYLPLYAGLYLHLGEPVHEVFRFLSAWGLLVVSGHRLWWAPAAYSLACLLRVPRKALLYEMALVMCGLEWYQTLILSHSPYLPTLPLVLLLLTLLAPESRALPMNGLDRHFACLDSSDLHPLAHWFVDTKEPFDRPALLSAIELLLRDMPMARSFVREAVLAMERFVCTRSWVTGEEILRWQTEPVEARPERMEEAIDLASSPPFRVTHAPRAEGGFRLVLTVHRSAADETGGMMCLDRLLQAYDEERAGGGFSLPPQDDPVRFRGIMLRKGLRWTLRTIRRHLTSKEDRGFWYASLLDDEIPRRSGSHHRVVDVPAADCERLKARAAELGVTREDLLVAASLRAAASLRQAHKEADRAFCVEVPRDLRPMLGLPASLSNVFGVARAHFALEEVSQETLPRVVADRTRLSGELDEALREPVRLGLPSLIRTPRGCRENLNAADWETRCFPISYVVCAIHVPAALHRPPTLERIWMCSSVSQRPGFALWPCLDGDRVSIGIGFLAANVSGASVSDYVSRLLAEIARV